jgi:hypothetical protein
MHGRGRRTTGAMIPGMSHRGVVLGLAASPALGGGCAATKNTPPAR